MSVTEDQMRLAISRLLMAREPSATVCPSEVARALAPKDWRPLMPQVRAVAFEMAKQGALDIRQRGRVVTPDEPHSGPIRLGLVITDEPPHTTTPDGRYLVIRERLWRRTNPNLDAHAREALIQELMDARRALRGRPTAEERAKAHQRVDDAKRALGE
jgi:hypothetical protein